jgi:hypothetical protein
MWNKLGHQHQQQCRQQILGTVPVPPPSWNTGPTMAMACDPRRAVRRQRQQPHRSATIKYAVSYNSRRCAVACCRAMLIITISSKPLVYLQYCLSFDCIQCGGHRYPIRCCWPTNVACSKGTYYVILGMDSDTVRGPIIPTQSSVAAPTFLEKTGDTTRGLVTNQALYCSKDWFILLTVIQPCVYYYRKQARRRRQ